MKKSIKGSETEKNLVKAYLDESQTALRYEWFAKEARKEGYEQISNLFLKTSSQEKAHAKRLFRYLEGGEVEITTRFASIRENLTIDNLKESVEDEHNEWIRKYAEYALIAANESFSEIAAVFRLLAFAEVTHERRFRSILKHLESNTMFIRTEEINWECLKCGYVHKGKEPPEICPACLHPKGYFEEELIQ